MKPIIIDVDKIEDFAKTAAEVVGRAAIIGLILASYAAAEFLNPDWQDKAGESAGMVRPSGDTTQPRLYVGSFAHTSFTAGRAADQEQATPQGVRLLRDNEVQR